LQDHPQPFIPTQVITMKPATFIAALIPMALAVPTPADNAAADVDKRAYGSYGSYPPPAGGYGSYGSYAAPNGGYGSYGTYKRAMGDFIKKMFG
jgi:uncharacterized membrane protein